MSIQPANGSAGVLVFSEHPDVAVELLGIGRALADAAGVELVALHAGEPLRQRAEDAVARGADEVRVLAPAQAERLGADGYLEALWQTVQERRPATVLVGSTRTGVEVAARLAQRLGVGCATDCIALEPGADGTLVVERRVFGGHFVARQVVHSAPAIATVPPKRFEAPPRDDARAGRIHEATLQLPAPRLRTIAVEERARSAVDISKAPVIVAVGRGLKRREDLALVEALAEVLGATLAGSRPVTDDLKWLPPDRKVGLSGQTVRPALYVACGISGQIEHVVGMRSARTVVAINTDPKAPIHGEADYSIVGDLYEIVPPLVAACRGARERQAVATLEALG
ncbi:MAG TPA: electron transfer flavoprotein subunit alpha/FixB family protein [Longimicrobiales bacterium]|nr:electron transfer flavoprotein subunit alpha/FixB family protein [Longimicrobiales bacterium]